IGHFVHSERRAVMCAGARATGTRDAGSVRCALMLFATALLWQALVAVAAAQRPSAGDPWAYPRLGAGKPLQRAGWAFQQRPHPIGDIPLGAKARALRQIDRIKTLQAAPLAPVAGATWFNIGPAPILGGRPVNGRVTTIAVDPANPSHWLVGGAQGGIWETADARSRWTPRTDAQPSLAMGAIAFAPSNPAIVYAGTGEANFSSDSYAGGGLLKSSDGGATWSVVSTAFAKDAFSAIKVDPGNPDAVVAALATGSAGR